MLNRLLYAIGGFDGENRLRSTECYCPDTNKWFLVASMNTPRSGAAAVAFHRYGRNNLLFFSLTMLIPSLTIGMIVVDISVYIQIFSKSDIKTFFQIFVNLISSKKTSISSANFLYA